MKALLLSFNPSIVSRENMLAHLDTLRDVKNWYAFGEAGVFLISTANASQVSALIHNKFPMLNFVVAEMSHVDGWQPAAAWGFVMKPKSSGRWPD